jgi:hypothetical protein
MRRSFVQVCVVLALAAVGAAGCDDDDPPTTPTPPTQTVTDTFTGSLSRNGAQTFNFAVSTNGQVTATLSELSSSTIPISIALGNWRENTCQVVLANDNAIQGTFVTGSMSAAGALCVRLSDATGTLEGTVTFKVDVVHP